MSVEKKAYAASGWVMVGVVVVGYLLSIAMMLGGILGLAMTDGEHGLVAFLASLVLLVATLICNCGFFTLQPGPPRRGTALGQPLLHPQPRHDQRR